MISFATFCKWMARAVFFVLIIIQYFFLVAYPATYKNNLIWYIAGTLLYSPTVIAWPCLIVYKAKLHYLFYVWYLYIIFALIPNITIIFFVVGTESIDRNKFLGPNALKMVLCITPLLLLLLLHSADDSDHNNKHRKLVYKLSLATIDLVYAVEMIDIVLKEKEHNFGIPKEFGKGMVLLACLCLLVSTGQLAENKLFGKEVKIRFKTAAIRNIIQIFFVRLPFLISCVVIYFKYGKDESISIVESGIGIILSFLEIGDICASRRAYNRLSRSDESGSVINIIII